MEGYGCSNDSSAPGGDGVTRVASDGYLETTNISEDDGTSGSSDSLQHNCSDLNVDTDLVAQCFRQQFYGKVSANWAVA